jgi:hypothetical protein
MWLRHLFSFAGTVLSIFFSTIGTTAIGWIIDAAYVGSIVREIVEQWDKHEGWRPMVARWRKNYLKGLRFSALTATLIYSPIILWSLGKAVYADHVYFASVSTKQRAEINGFPSQVQQLKDGYATDITNLKTECALVKGKNQILQTQNGAQQNTINNCLQEAIKLIAPPQLAIDTYSFSAPVRSVGVFFNVVAITNKDIEPIDLILSCDGDVQPIGIAIPSPGTTAVQSIGSGFQRIGPASFHFHQTLPKWEANHPIGLSFIARSSSTQCKWTQGKK